MKTQKFRIQHATATPKPQLKRRMRDAIRRALSDAKASRSFAAFMRQACDATAIECPRADATCSRLHHSAPDDQAAPGQQGRPAAQHK